MKKLLLIAFSLILAVSLFSCGEGKEEAETTQKSDWRNTIEYEGSFYVNSDLRVLYAFDKGTITLWDDSKGGETLQTISYETSVSDAIERIEKEDFNGDGNRDIRIIYTESEEGTKYSLFLWSEKTGRFAECSLYKTILDPVIDPETFTVTGVSDLGIFGTVTAVYTFNDTSGLDVSSMEIADVDAVAKTICDATVGGTLRSAEGKATINNQECSVYISSDDSGDTAYFAYTPDSQWFIDKGCIGLYRKLEANGDTVILGKYTDDAAAAEDLAKKILSEESIEITMVTEGVVNGKAATKYDIKGESSKEIYLIRTENGYWYCSENNTEFYSINASTGLPVEEDSETVEFAVS